MLLNTAFYFMLQVVLYVKEEMKRNELPEPAVIGLLWTCVMNAVEWNKKEELVAEQALKHLKVCTWVMRGRACCETTEYILELPSSYLFKSKRFSLKG